MDAIPMFPMARRVRLVRRASEGATRLAWWQVVRLVVRRAVGGGLAWGLVAQPAARNRSQEGPHNAAAQEGCAKRCGAAPHRGRGETLNLQ